MNMQNVSCCEGCFYAGVPNGYRPECSCEVKEIIETKSQIEDEEQDLYFDYTEKTLSSLFDKDRETPLYRRANKAKSVNRAVKALSIVESKYARLPQKPTDQEVSAATRKISNVAKIAKPRYQMSLLLSFPKIPETHYDSRSIFRLIARLESWKRNAESPDSERKNDELALACKKAIKMLNTATLYDGVLCSLHREENDLHIKIGFLDKASLSNFERKLSKISAATI